MNPFRLALVAVAGSALTLAAVAAPNPEQAVPDQLDLPQALRFALDNNFAIRQARERVNQAEGGVTAAQAGRLPTASVEAAYSRTSDRIKTTPADQLWQASVGVNQALYAGGAVTAGVTSARAQREAANFELQAVTNGVLAGVRSAFYNVLQTQQTIKVREEALRLLEEELKNAKNRYEAGAGAQFDVLRAEVALANGRPPLIRARNDHRIAIEELRQVLGFTTKNEPNLVKVPDFVGELAFVEEKFELRAALEAARANRPELKALAQGVTAAEAGVTAAKAGRRPTVGARAAWEVSRNPYASGFSSNMDGWTVGVTSSWAIWDGNATAGKVRAARSGAELAKLSLEERELAIDVEVRRAFASWQDSNELVASSNKVVEQAKEALRLSRARFEVGAATQLDVLQAQVALTEAGNNQVQALFAHNLAVVELRRAMGLTEPAAHS